MLSTSEDDTKSLVHVVKVCLSSALYFRLIIVVLGVVQEVVIGKTVVVVAAIVVAVVVVVAVAVVAVSYTHLTLPTNREV